jgi:hypothetical protein
LCCGGGFWGLAWFASKSRVATTTTPASSQEEKPPGVGNTKSASEVEPTSIPPGPSPATDVAELSDQPMKQRELRVWGDNSGKFHVVAEFVEVTDDVVTLRKSNGSTVEVPLQRLSEKDKEFVENLGSDDASSENSQP